MIVKFIFIFFGLLGLIGGLAELMKTKNHQSIPLFFLSGLISCHTLLLIAGVMLFLYPAHLFWLILTICFLTVISRIANAYFYYGTIRWSHHLFSTILFTVCLGFLYQ